MSEAISGLIGVIVGSAITVAKDYIVGAADRKRKNRYAAMRIICILEEYAEKCVDVVGDDGTACGQPAGRTEDGQEFNDPQVKLPHPPIYPEDINWENISKALLYRILMLPNAARETDRSVFTISEHSDPPDYAEMFDARQEGYTNLGLEALNLAHELRKEYKIPEKTLETLHPDWNPKQHLENKKQEIEKKKRSS